MIRISAGSLRTFNLWATIGWLVLVIPTIVWWRQSLLWIALMSVWANVASHFSAWMAARAEDAATPSETSEPS
jgi:TM2 domain-containing membrane protein YozV